MGGIDELFAAAIDVHGLDLSIIMTYDDFAIKNIDSGGKVVLLKSNLSQELILTLIAREYRDHIVLTSGDKDSLGATNSGDFTSMGLEDETEVLLLIPNVNTTIGTTGVADTILIERSAVESSLGIFLSEGTILEKFLACIGWVPELNRSRGDGDELEIIWLFGPLDVHDGVGACRKSQEHLLSLHVVDVHVVVIAAVDAGDVSLAWTDGKGSDSLG